MKKKMEKKRCKRKRILKERDENNERKELLKR